MNWAFGKAFGDDRSFGPVQKNVAAVKIAKNGSAEVYRMHAVSIFVFVEHAENNPCFFEVPHHNTDRRHILHNIPSSACGPEVQPAGRAVAYAVADCYIAH